MTIIKAKDFTEKLSKAGHVRYTKQNASLGKYGPKNPKIISLGLGDPRPDTFIFSEVSATVANLYNKDGSSDSTDSAQTTISLSEKKSPGSLVEGLDVLLQYGDGYGVRSLLGYAKNLVKNSHCPQYEDWDVIISCGSTDGLDKATDVFLNDGDNIIVDEYTYINAIKTFEAKSYNQVSVGMDTEGMIPEELDRVCSNWQGPNPLKAIYLIPTGQNPTGTTMSLQRRKDIYSVCQKHDLIIIEDDPYYYIQFGDAPVADGETTLSPEYLSKLPGTKNLLPSMLLFDVDGRVIRLDSMSKLMAPNLRTGWITAQKRVIDVIRAHTDTTLIRANGLSMGLLSRLFLEEWKEEGFEKHVAFVQKQYVYRRNLLVKSMKERLGNMIEFSVPETGMFVWLKVNLPDEAKREGVVDELFERMTEKNMLMIPGFLFSADQKNPNVKDIPYFRATFVYAPLEELDMAIERLETVLLEFGCKK
ncbi:hypothetical protein BB558_007448 [Smittium angustum]|uniref:Aminotransferase class I/classII large domain-containing protein n=1 Tax=Smittium angustum TaxID=133377 RepID=A0A2U1IUY5_SMIAN|nr:hypothetical protein BB558_007448 [Smittium angustum]